MTTTSQPQTSPPQTSQPRGALGRPVLGAVFGLLFGLFLAFDLLMFGVFSLESVLVLVVPLVFLVAGAAFGWFAPFRYLRR